MSELTRPSTLTLRASLSAAPRSHPKEASRSAPPERATAKPSDVNSQGERIVRSDTLLQGRSHVLIAHNGETYQLRATRLGKLILTK